MMVSPQNDHQNPKFPLMVRQDSLNNLNLNDNLHPKEEEEEEEGEAEGEGEGEEALFIQNPSSSSSAPKVFGNIHLKELSCKTSIEHVWDKIFHVKATNSDMCFQEQLSLGETTSYEQVLVSDGNVNDHHSMEISPQPLMSIDPMAMDDPPSFKVLPEIGNYLDDQQLLGFPALPLQVERKRCKSTNETMEKSVERRQRRMIKNRESAARSRARKQAHTTMLENQVSELRRRNNWLKKLKEAETVLNSDQQAAPRFQLRRTTSSTF